MHKVKVIHRNITNKSVLLDIDGNVHLCNFSNAILLSSLDAEDRKVVELKNYKKKFAYPELFDRALK